jgi:hypothetical protein
MPEKITVNVSLLEFAVVQRLRQLNFGKVIIGKTNGEIVNITTESNQKPNDLMLEVANTKYPVAEVTTDMEQYGKRFINNK